MRYFFSILFFVLCSTISYGQWVNLNTGITDNLTGVVFLNQNGLACGQNGLYYTTNGGVGAGSWTEFVITNSPVNSAIYQNTVFTHCYSKSNNTSSTGSVYACGQDTVTNKAIIIKISFPSLAYQIKYVGPVNSKLNKIDYNHNLDRYLAVGDDGLLLSFSDTALSTISTGLTEDLLSVSTDGSKILIGSEQKIYRAYIYASDIGSIEEIPTPNIANKDVSFAGNNEYNLYGLGTNSLSYTDFLYPTNFITRYNQNFYSPLDANGIINFSNNFYIGTNQGIYLCSAATSSFQNVSIEWQLSSLNFHINDFWKQPGNNDFYAFGNNGVILKTTGNGGATKPYVRINSDGGCYPGSTLLNAFTGSGTTNSWSSNGSLIQNNSNSFYHTFPAIGAYNISLTVQNSAGVQSTVSKIINIVNPPEIDKVITLSDSILCKQEIIQIQIVDSEPTIIYTLRKEGEPDSNFGESQPSTGGDLTFNSALIDVTGNYYIDAKSSLANCRQRFTDNFLITVEETKADFHSGLINAEVNEIIHFYENTIDSQNFEWQFFPNASIVTSALPNPQVSFNSPGQITTTLHSWSNNDCHDTVIESKPFVFETPTVQNDGFFLANNSPDPTWLGYYNPDISQMIPTADGFLTCGTYFNQIFDSNYGTTHALADKRGGYLAKHDRNGVLKWVVYNINNESGNNNNDNVIYSTAVDSNNNIYISGKGIGNFIDNTGRVTNLSAPLEQPEFYIIKLNSKGELIWYTQIHNLGFVKLAIDQNDNLIALSDYRTDFTTIQLFFNGSISQEIGQQVVFPDATNLIVKFSPTGSVIWDAKAYLASANIREFRDLGIDSNNNIYIAMAFDIQATIYEPGPFTSAGYIGGDGNWGSKIGIVKLNSNGIIQWTLRSRTINNLEIQSDFTIVNRMIVEPDGTIYLTGNNSTGFNSVGPLNYTHIFENTDETIVSTQKGPYFVAKINANGICQWIKGAGHTYYGEGSNLLKKDNEIFVVGQFSANSNETTSALFDSTNGIGYNLTINKYDYFISVYDEAGNLKRLFVNNEGNNFVNFWGFNGFFKGNGDYFYLSKNIGATSSTLVYSDFGMTSPALNGRDGTIVRFTESSAVLKYSATLSTNDWSNDALGNLTIVPNPATDNFNIELNTTFENIYLEVYDITGKKISHERFNNVSKITSSLSGQSGLYFVLLKTENGQKWFKLIKS